MKTTIFFATALVSLFGLTACGGSSTNNTGVDASCPGCAQTDLATTDSGSDLDSGLQATTCPLAYTSSACTASNIVDKTAMTTVEIDFGVSGSLTYSPACIKVKQGTVVTFSGDFSSHPLASESCSPTALTPPSSGTTKAFTLNTVGVYNYYCQIHKSFNMAGVIQVVAP